MEDTDILLVGGEEQQRDIADATTVDVSPAKESPIEVEVVDDTAPEDKPRPPKDPNYKPYSPETDDELDQYSEKVKKRISRLNYQWREEEREKKAALGREAAAIQYADAVRKQAEGFRKQLADMQKTALTAVTAKTETELEKVQKELVVANEMGQFAEAAEKQRRLAELAAEKVNLSRIPEPTEAHIPQLPAPPPAPVADVSDRTKRWVSDNPWFQTATVMNGQGQPMSIPTNAMSSVALATHESLIKRGVSPDSEQYYESIDSEMRKRFPEAFSQEQQQQPVAKTAPQKKTAAVVAPVVRVSSTGKRTVRLSPSQIHVAKQLGLTPQQYAEQIAEEANA